MKKSEMSSRSLEERRIFLQHLELRGWEVNSWDEMLDIGANVDPEAEAIYVGPIFELHLEYHAEAHYLGLEMVQQQGERILFLRLYPRGDMESLLVKITSAQDMLDSENYPELIKSLIPLCDPLLIETDQGFHRLE